MEDRHVVLGIDIGGTKTSFGFVDRTGFILNAASMPTQAKQSVDNFIFRLNHQIEKIRADLPSSHHLCGIGIGAPNAHHERGTVEKAVNLNWGRSFDLVSVMENHYNIPVTLTNDANAAAIGEMLFGNACGMKNFIVITLGTGLGSGIVINGNLLYGASGFAGELGHTTVDPHGRQCRCGKRGCLETYVSAAGLRRTVATLLAETYHPCPLRSISYQKTTSRQIFKLALEGDAIALEAFDRTARILGIKLADAVAHLSPEAIFLAGGLALAGDILFTPTRRYMNDFLFAAYRGTVKLLPSGLEPGASAILGAAALIWHKLKHL
jgi:glucokinase